MAAAAEFLRVSLKLASVLTLRAGKAAVVNDTSSTEAEEAEN